MNEKTIRQIVREEALDLIMDFHLKLNLLRAVNSFESRMEQSSELIAIHNVIDEMREELRGKEGVSDVSRATGSISASKELGWSLLKKGKK